MVRELIKSVTGYPGLFLLCVVSGIAVPLPEDFTLLYAGMRIAAGEASWWAVIPIAVLGVGGRDLIAFGIGRVAGRWLLGRPWGVRLMGGTRTVDWARGLVENHGDRAVLLGRFAVGFRAPVFMVGGAMGLSLRRFIVWDGLGLLVAVPLTIGLGSVFGQPLVDGMYWALQRARIVVAAVVLVAAVVWLRRILRHDPEASDD